MEFTTELSLKYDVGFSPFEEINILNSVYYEKMEKKGYQSSGSGGDSGRGRSSGPSLEAGRPKRDPGP